MHTLIAAALLALLPIAAAAVPGGKACQVAESAVPTPGLGELVMGSKTDPVPVQARLTEAQINTLADLDTKLRGTLSGIDARAAKLPAGKAAAGNAELARQELPELVTRFLAEASRDSALLINVESAPEFRLANAEALEAKLRGDNSRWCALCLAVRQGMEADFAWRAGEFGSLSPEQQKEAAELASMRDEVRRKWTTTLKAQLSPAQLARLQAAQMRWLKSALAGAVADGMGSLGAEKCGACTTKVEWKCEFCSIVLHAVEQAKSKG